MAGDGLHWPFNCYKTPGLGDPILGTTAHVSCLESRYGLGDQLGWGQFGLIRSCTDLLTGELLACKSIKKDRLVSSEDLRSVKLEIDVMARLSVHPNVVALRAVYEDSENVHLVMELCAGGELFHRLEQHGRFPESQAATIFRQLVEVVTYCHENGVVHRDLKPENILLADDSSSSPIKLADFGLATYFKPGQSLQGTVGSPFYIAPEVLSGGYNEAADVWSAGVILYILLSGIPPFWGKTKSRIFDAVRTAELCFPSDSWDSISVSAKELITGMLCRDPTKRLTAKQVLDHPWLKECAENLENPFWLPGIKFGQQDAGSCSFSTPLASKSRDVSCNCGTPVTCEAHSDHSSPAFTCRSSFSAFLASATPSVPSFVFSFKKSSNSNSVESTSPIRTMPSFSFFSPPLMSEKEGHVSFASGLSSRDTVQSEASIGKLLKEADSKAAEIRRGSGPASRTISIASKRNHTIGLGELEQLDLMVSESVIRWASCNHLPSATSLRSSLVC